MVKYSLCRRAHGHSRVLLAFAATFALVGCGAHAKVSGGRSTRFSQPVLARVSESVSTVGCRPLAKHVDTRGTTFAVAENQALTASHVVRSGCVAHSEITLFGGRSAVVATRSPAHGLALLDLVGYRAKSVLRPARARIGERLALMGYPNDSVNAPLRVTYGKVLAVNRVETLTGRIGVETLRDAVVVSAPAGRGESGGPAIDTAGHVVGVIEGGNGYISVLTPAVDVALLRRRALHIRSEGE